MGIGSEIFNGWLGRLGGRNAVVVVCNTFAGATGDRCCATTLETLETLVAVRVIVAVTLAQLQRARSGVGIGSEIFDGWLGRLGWRNAVVVVINTFAGATGDRCCATTLETLETLVTLRVLVAVTLAKLQRARSGVGIGSEIFNGWLAWLLRGSLLRRRLNAVVV